MTGNRNEYTAAQNTIAVLADLFPACFAIFEQRRRPLKLKIPVDVLVALAGAITPKELAAAMRFYCANSGYLKACTEGTPRIDLNGEAAGTVSAEEADNAKRRLQQRRRSNGARPARAVSVDTTPTKPRLSLADLRKAAQARRQRPGA
jgi:ProP effector